MKSYISVTDTDGISIGICDTVCLATSSNAELHALQAQCCLSNALDSANIFGTDLIVCAIGCDCFVKTSLPQCIIKVYGATLPDLGWWVNPKAVRLVEIASNDACGSTTIHVDDGDEAFKVVESDTVSNSNETRDSNEDANSVSENGNSLPYQSTDEDEEENNSDTTSNSSVPGDAEISEDMDDCEELHTNLADQIHRDVRDQKIDIGDIVQVLDNEDTVRHQTEGWYPEEFSRWLQGVHAIVRHFEANGDPDDQFCGASPPRRAQRHRNEYKSQSYVTDIERYHEDLFAPNVQIMMHCFLVRRIFSTEATFEGTDRDGKVIKRGDTVQILANEAAWDNKAMSLLGKCGRVLYFYPNGDACVIVARVYARLKRASVFLIDPGTGILRMCPSV